MVTKSRGQMTFSRFVRSEDYSELRDSLVYHGVEELASLSPEARRLAREPNLNLLLDYAIERVPRYKQIDAGVKRERGIFAFPYISRSELRNPRPFVATGVTPCRWNKTSGSTNEPVSTALGSTHEVNQTAKWIRHFQRFPVHDHNETTFVIPRSYRLRVFGGGILRDLASGHFVRQLHSPTDGTLNVANVVIGNPFLLQSLFPNGWLPSRSCLITSFEQSPDDRDRWAADFHGDVYGLSEVGCVAWRRVEGDSEWEVHDDMVVYEVANPRTRNKAVVGELVVTDLTNYTMPIIRYRTGDVVEVEFGSDTRNPRVRSVFGRSIGTKGTVIEGWDVMSNLVSPLLEECSHFRVYADRESVVILCEGSSNEGLCRLRQRFKRRGLEIRLTENVSDLAGLQPVIRTPLEGSK